MPFYSRQFLTLKEAVQGALPYSEDLTAATEEVVITMGADWTGLSGQDWQDDFVSEMAKQCLANIPSALWGFETEANRVIIRKKQTQIVSFTLLSNNYWEVVLPDLELELWTRHP
jgi:hypothetical protein